MKPDLFFLASISLLTISWCIPIEIPARTRQLAWFKQFYTWKEDGYCLDFQVTHELLSERSFVSFRRVSSVDRLSKSKETFPKKTLKTFSGKGSLIPRLIFEINGKKSFSVPVCFLFFRLKGDEAGFSSGWNYAFHRLASAKYSPSPQKGRCWVVQYTQRLNAPSAERPIRSIVLNLSKARQITVDILDFCSFLWYKLL